MSSSKHADILPDILISGLKAMGEDMAACRKLRKLTQKDMADRLHVSRRTIIAMEAGDPGVAFGSYLTAAWVMGLDAGLLTSFAPHNDSQSARLARLNLPKRVSSAAARVEDFDDDGLNF